MTLGGLALAVGILVDEATVAIENIHTHLARGVAERARGARRGARDGVPRLLAMLCVVAVFVPSFFMTGVGAALFVPLSLAVGFAMIASFLLSSTLVPVLSVWLLRRARSAAKSRADCSSRDVMARSQRGAARAALAASRWYADLRGGAVICDCDRAPRLGTEIFPPGDAGQFQLRFRAPAGTQFERTEAHRAGGPRRDQATRPARTTSTSRWLCRRAAVRLSDQHHLPVDRRPAGRRAAGRS